MPMLCKVRVLRVGYARRLNVWDTAMSTEGTIDVTIACEHNTFFDQDGSAAGGGDCVGGGRRRPCLEPAVSGGR